jgi:HAD superfamily hydrolase (TIGR01549 family)
MIKCIIFDFDGVIINHFEKDFECFQKKYPNLTKDEFKIFFEGNFFIQANKLKERDNGFDGDECYNQHLKKTIIPNKAKEIIKELSKNYLLGIISSSPNEGLNICVNNSNLKENFSFVYGCDTHKLKLEKFKMVFENFNLKPEECVFVTDTLGDILESKKVSMKAIALENGYHERERLEKGNPWKIISSFEKLIETINK